MPGVFNSHFELYRMRERGIELNRDTGRKKPRLGAAFFQAIAA